MGNGTRRCRSQRYYLGCCNRAKNKTSFGGCIYLQQGLKVWDFLFQKKEIFGFWSIKQTKNIRCLMVKKCVYEISGFDSGQVHLIFSHPFAFQSPSITKIISANQCTYSLIAVGYHCPHQWECIVHILMSLQGFISQADYFGFSAEVLRTTAPCMDISDSPETPLRYEVSYPRMTHFSGWLGELAFRHERQFFEVEGSCKSQTPIINERRGDYGLKSFNCLKWKPPVVIVAYCCKTWVRTSLILAHCKHPLIPE